MSRKIESDNMDYNFQLRMKQDEMTALKAKCTTIHRRHSDVVRELIAGFMQGKINLTDLEGETS